MEVNERNSHIFPKFPDCNFIIPAALFCTGGLEYEIFFFYKMVFMNSDCLVVQGDISVMHSPDSRPFVTWKSTVKPTNFADINIVNCVVKLIWRLLFWRI